MRLKTRVVGLGIGLGMTAVAFMPGVAHAADSNCGYTGCTNPSVPPSNPPGNQTVTSDPFANQAPSGGLPFTGADVAGMTIIGVAALATGSVLVYRSRRSAVTQ